jgi:ABC-type glycerol-3-phosphate transport system substrate-binding protein
MYLGLGTEIRDIEIENPNLSFGVAPVPQAQGVTAFRNYGTFYGFVIPKSSRNPSGALKVAHKLSSGAVAQDLTEALDIVPVLRSLYGDESNSVHTEVLHQSALVSRGWLDPSPKDSAAVFKEMIDEISSGRKEIDEVLQDAVYTLETLFR